MKFVAVDDEMESIKDDWIDSDKEDVNQKYKKLNVIYFKKGSGEVVIYLKDITDQDDRRAIAKHQFENILKCGLIGGNKYMQELYKISEACREFKQFGQFVSNSAAIGEHSILLQLMDHMITLKDKHMMFLTRSELTYNDLDETRPTSINAYSLICYIDGMIYTGDANAGTVDLRTGFGCLITTEDCKLNPELDIGQVTSYDIDGFYEKIKSVGGYVYGMVFPHHGSISEGSRGVRNALLQKTMKLVFIPNSANNKSQVSQEGPSQVQNTTTQSRLLKITSTRPTLKSLSKLVALHHTDNAIASIAVWSEKDPSYYPTVFECDIKGNIKYVTHIPLKEDDVKVVGYTADSK